LETADRITVDNSSKFIASDRLRHIDVHVVAFRR